MRFKAMLAVALVLAACSSSPDEDTDALDEPQTPTSNHIPEDIYQPTVHAILALGGGYEAGDTGNAIQTIWRRAGTGQSVRLRLSPGEVTVQAMDAGRYVLDSLVVDGSELLVSGAGEQAASPVGDVVLDPGDVIYGGDLVVREGSKSSSGNTRNLVLRIKSNAERARAAIAQSYARQAPQMQTRLVRKR